MYSGKCLAAVHASLPVTNALQAIGRTRLLSKGH